MKPHPSEHQLRQWLDGSLDEAESRLIESHIESCPDVCQRRLDKLPAGAVARTRELRLTWSGRLAGPGDTPDVSATPQSPTPTSPETPAVPRGYEFIAVLGRGGMGSVVRARELALARDVAIKFVEPRFGVADPRFFTRFALEAEAMARLRHPNIVPVYAVGDTGGRPFLAMELAEGGSLSERLKSASPLDARQAAAICELLARAAHHAHERGVIHRDLKPSNILLAAPPEPATQGAIPPAAARIGDALWVPKVSDFGLVKIEDAASPSAAADVPTLAGEVWGSPGFMSPEQARGDVSAVGVRTDVHALGAILYFLLVGRSPFDAATAALVIERVKADPPASPRKLRQDIPADLETICLKALQKSPVDRYASAADLADDLRRFLDGRPIAARPFGPAERAWRWAKRNKALASALLATVIAMVAGTAVSLWYADQARQSAADSERRRIDADTARGVADQQTALARRSADEAGEQLTRAEWRTYVALLARAQSLLEAGKPAEARDVLDACRWDLRGWEHGHLRRLAESPTDAVRAIAVPGSLAAGVSASGEHAIAVTTDALVRVGVSGGAVSTVPRQSAEWPRGAVSLSGRVAAWVTPGGVEIARLDAAGNVERRSTLARPAAPRDVSISPDDRWLTIAEDSGKPTCWDIAGDTPIEVALGEQPNLDFRAPLISPGRRFLVQHMTSGQVRDMTTRTILPPLRHPDGAPVVSGKFSRDGALLALGDIRGVTTIWRTGDWSLQSTLRPPPAATANDLIGAIAFSPDGSRLATATFTAGQGKSTLRLWSVSTGELALTLEAFADETHDLCFSRDGRRLLIADGKRLLILDAGEPSAFRRLVGVEDDLYSVAFLPDGGTATAISSRRNALFASQRHAATWDLTTGRRLDGPDSAGHVAGSAGSDVAIHPDGQRFATSDYPGPFFLLDRRSGRRLLTFDAGPSTAAQCQFSPDGKLLAGSCNSDRGGIWDVETGKLLRYLERCPKGARLKFSPDSKRVAASGTGKSVPVWDVQTGRLIRLIVSPFVDLAFGTPLHAPDRLLTFSSDGDGVVWDLTSGQAVLSLKAPVNQVHAVVISPACDIAAVGGYRSVALVDLTIGKVVRQFPGAPEMTWSLAFDRTGERLLAGGSDGSATMWTVEP